MDQAVRNSDELLDGVRMELFKIADEKYHMRDASHHCIGINPDDSLRWPEMFDLRPDQGLGENPPKVGRAP